MPESDRPPLAERLAALHAKADAIRAGKALQADPGAAGQIRAQIAEHELAIEQLRRGMMTAFTAAGMPQEQEPRPDLKVIRGGLAS